MVFTITVLGNGGQYSGEQQQPQQQQPSAAGHALISSDLAQLMSASQSQPLSGMLNPDGSITLNAGLVPQLTIPQQHATQQQQQQAQQQSSMPAASASDSSNTNHSHNHQHSHHNHSPSNTNGSLQTEADNQFKVVATVQLPNGQVGQLIAPPGAQIWPSSINLQQLSMAVAAATNAAEINDTYNCQSRYNVNNNNSSSSSNNSNNNGNSSNHQANSNHQSSNNDLNEISSNQQQQRQEAINPPPAAKKLKRLACVCPNCRDGENNKSSGAKKQHICHYQGCNKVYGKTSHLRAHLRWHNGERPYVCNWSTCGKRFTRSDELQRHKRTHTGEKRFQCLECAKKFMRSDHLSKHLRTHLIDKKVHSNNNIISNNNNNNNNIIHDDTSNGSTQKEISKSHSVDNVVDKLLIKQESVVGNVVANANLVDTKTSGV